MTKARVKAKLDPIPNETTIRPHLLDLTKERDGVSYCAVSYEPFWTHKTTVSGGGRHQGMYAWKVFGDSWASSAAARNFTGNQGQVWCKNDFPLPWEAGWGSYTACSHDPTQGDDAS